LQEVAGGNRAAALEGIGVERIKRAKSHHSQGATLRRLGIDPVEMREAGRILEHAELRIAVAFADGCADGKAQGQTNEYQEGTYHDPDGLGIRPVTVTACIGRKKTTAQRAESHSRTRTCGSELAREGSSPSATSSAA